MPIEHPEARQYGDLANLIGLSLSTARGNEGRVPQEPQTSGVNNELKRIFPDLIQLVSISADIQQTGEASTPPKPTDEDASNFPEYKKKALNWAISKVSASCQNKCSEIIFDTVASYLPTQIIEKLNPLSHDDYLHLSGKNSQALSGGAMVYLGVLRESYVLFALLRMFYLQKLYDFKIEGLYFSPQADRDHSIDFIVVLKEPPAVAFLSVSSPHYESRPAPPEQLKKVLQESGYPTIEANIPITWNFVRRPEDGIDDAERIIINAIKKIPNTQSARAEATHLPPPHAASGRRRLSQAVKPPPPPAPSSSSRGRAILG